MKNRYFKLTLPVVLLFALIIALVTFMRVNNFHLSTTDNQQYETNIYGTPERNVIYLVSILEYRFLRPKWWLQNPRLSFVSATIEDSNHINIPADELTESNSFNGDFFYNHEIRKMGHVSIIRPRGDYDLSRGGRITLRMQVHSQEAQQISYWEGEVSASLPPTKMHP